MAKTIIRASEGTEAKAEKAVETAKKTASTATKKAQTVIEATPTKGSATGYRIGAIVLWLLAIGCEILAIMALLKDFVIRFTNNGTSFYGRKFHKYFFDM